MTNRRTSSRRLPPIVWNALTGLTLASTCCACAFISLIFLNPQSSLNPFPPPTRTPWSGVLPADSTPAGAEPRGLPTLPPAWTPTPLGGPSATPPATATSVGAAPAGTAAASATPASLAPTATAAAAGPTASATAGPSVTPTATATATATPAAPTATPVDTGYSEPINTPPPSSYP